MKMRLAANIFSVLTHPVFHPLVMCCILLKASFMLMIRPWPTILITAVSIVAVPMLLMFFLKKLRAMTSITADERSERTAPLIFMGIALFFTADFFSKTPFVIFSLYLYAMFWITVAAFVINFFWKISLHALGCGGFCTFLAVLTHQNEDFFPFLILALVFAGLIGSARLYLKQHDISQVFAGYAVGAAVTVVSVL